MPEDVCADAASKGSRCQQLTDRNVLLLDGLQLMHSHAGGDSKPRQQSSVSEQTLLPPAVLITLYVAKVPVPSATAAGATGSFLPDSPPA